MGEEGRRGNLACVDTYDISTDDLMLEDPRGFHNSKKEEL